MTVEPIRTMTIDRMPVQIYDTNQALGARAAADLAAIIAQAVGARGLASLILATGNSQLSFIEALRVVEGIPWDKVMEGEEYSAEVPYQKEGVQGTWTLRLIPVGTE